MYVKSLLFLLLSAISLHSVGQTKKAATFINPTGSYKLDSHTEKRDGETYGYFGDADVKLLSKSRIAISLYVCRGALGYNSGSFVDTLDYRNNRAVYTTPEFDSSCRITLVFSPKGISITQKQANLNDGCGFGQGVFADGFYKKVSSKIPVIKDKF